MNRSRLITVIQYHLLINTNATSFRTFTLSPDHSLKHLISTPESVAVLKEQVHLLADEKEKFSYSGTLKGLTTSQQQKISCMGVFCLDTLV